MKRKNAFTMAEVLITLGIIGVIAALTIPNLVNEYQKIQYVAKLKKVDSQFNQALVKMAIDNGCPTDLACTGFFTSGTDYTIFGNEIVKYFKVVKNCGIEKNKGCGISTYNRRYDGSGAFEDFDTNIAYKFLTEDGISYIVGSYADNCNNDSGHAVLGYSKKICGWVRVDVNGAKGPNYWGRDIFQFYITNGKGPLLYPSGGREEYINNWWNYNGANKCSSTSTGDDKDGQYCTGRVIENGWIMDY